MSLTELLRKARYRLALNENLFLPKELVAEVVEQAARLIDPRLYPDMYGEGLRAKIAERLGVKESEVIVGPGSDSIIEAIALARRGLAVIVEPTFEEYRRAVEAFGSRVREVLLRQDFSLDPEAVVSAARGADVVFLASPNNPTGNQFSRDAVEAVLEGVKGLVVIDEAYAEYAKYTMVDALSEYENLVILRTFSKAWGLAGLRVGYGIARANVVRELVKAMRPFATSAVSLKAAELMLEREREIMEAVKRTIQAREWLSREISALEGAKPYPSDANFLLVKLAVNGHEAWRKLLEAGFLVKDLSGVPLCENCLRITVPPVDIGRRLIAALKEAIGELAG